MDSHSVSKGTEEASGSNSNGESESRLSMDRDLYNAAAKGNVEPFKFMEKDVIERLVTVTNNTILHINIIAKESSTEFAEEILVICPSLLFQVNARGDTPLHIAAKCNRVDIVKVLIEKVKFQHNDEDDLESGTVGATNFRQMIGMRNNEKNTALHEAVCHKNKDIVEILVKELPEFSYSINCYGETPLYMAVARLFHEIVTTILINCPSPALEGPFGKTVLHAAARGFFGSDLLKQIVERKKSSIRDRDQYGWTPLHYAAYFSRSFETKQLLAFDRSAASIVDKDRKMTPLHLAAAQGNADIVDLIISYCPECCELVDDIGWNVLHFAMLSFNGQQLISFLKNPFVRNLINEKDVKGNTPLHLLAAFCSDETYHINDYNIGGDYYAVNNQKRSVRQIISYGSPELKQEIQELSKGVDNELYPNGFIKIIEDKWKSTKTIMKTKWELVEDYVLGAKIEEAQLIVAALIATVTFTVGFTLPGGYRSEEGPGQGTAILSRKSAFQAFVITDTIAMVLSLSAVFIHFIMSLQAFKQLVFLFVLALLFTLVAMIAMVIAFITGTYAMLSPSLGLVIPTCSIGLSFFLLIFYLLCKAFRVKVTKDIEQAFWDKVTER